MFKYPKMSSLGYAKMQDDMSKTNLFTEEKYNALYQALEECAKKYNESEKEWLRNTHEKLVVVLLVDKLEELGYIIVKK